MFRCLLATALLFATTLTATAQSTKAPTQTILAGPRPRTVADWPVATRSASDDHVLAIVTIARPGIRQSCKVDEITEDAIVCRSNHHKKITYQRDEIAALIEPPSHHERNIMLVPVALMAVSLVGSFFVPLAFSIAMRVFAAVCFSAFGAMGIGAAANDHNNDILIYQSPDTPLTVKLRLRQGVSDAVPPAPTAPTL